MKVNWLKVAGVGATVLGAAASVVASVVGNKQQEQKIAEAAQKAVADLVNKEN